MGAISSIEELSAGATTQQQPPKEVTNVQQSPPPSPGDAAPGDSDSGE